jgi:lipopolysaccharide transport system permease protein
MPIAIVICLFTATGFGLWLAALNVKYRDFRYALPFLLQLLFFGTQVIYPYSVFKHSAWNYLFAFNPMNAVVELFRSALIRQQPDSTLIAIGLTTGILITLSGYLFFKKTEQYFADLA